MVRRTSVQFLLTNVIHAWTRHKKRREMRGSQAVTLAAPRQQSRQETQSRSLTSVLTQSWQLASPTVKVQVEETEEEGKG